MKKLLALLLAAALVLSMAACAKTPGTDDTTAPGTEGNDPTAGVDNGTYTYTDSVSTLATNWNPHSYQTNDDAYPQNYIASGLYSFVFNDEHHPVEGFEPFTTYAIIPEMAAEEPVDVTEEIKASHPEFGIPESATSGFAYTIKLNPNATFDDGTPIKAVDYVESMKRLLDPRLLNYRAADYFGAADLAIAGAEQYYYSLTENLYQMVSYADAEAMMAAGEDVYIDVYAFWNASAEYTDAEGNALPQYVSVNDETVYGENMEDAFSGKMLITDYIDLFSDGSNPLYKAVTNENYNEDYASTYDSLVGCFASDEYEITLVLEKSLSGFYLLYSLTSNWLVKTDLYDSCIKETEGVWSCTYNTSLETTCSYGPYKMSAYQTDKAMHFVKNDAWYGWTDGQHVYTDPTDGQTYTMYQTTEIDTQVVADPATNKMMFLKGQLMTYGLQADDMATYRNSEYCYDAPADTIFFMILNGHKEAIGNREKDASFDQSTTDLESMTLLNFRKAVAVSYDKELFAATVSPARSGAYAIIGETYIYDPATGATYRDTDAAKQVLCDFYGIDTSKYADLDAAVDSITGYDPELAKELFAEAFNEALEAGYVTDNDGDSICDQTVTIEYALSTDSDFMTKTIDYLNEKMNEATEGTPYAGKIQFVKSAPYGNDWSNKIREGMSDTVLGGWTGARMNPFGLTDLYVNPDRAYDAKWFNPYQHELTIEIDGEELTMSLYEWSDALNGNVVTVDGVDYNFGDGQADVETRVKILAAFEGAILGTYDYLPMMQDGSMFLLTQKAYYVVEDYNGVMERGGIQYLKYNYDDAEWNDYVAEQGGELKY